MRVLRTSGPDRHPSRPTRPWGTESGNGATSRRSTFATSKDAFRRSRGAALRSVGVRKSNGSRVRNLCRTWCGRRRYRIRFRERAFGHQFLGLVYLRPPRNCGVRGRVERVVRFLFDFGSYVLSDRVPLSQFLPVFSAVFGQEDVCLGPPHPPSEGLSGDEKHAGRGQEIVVEIV